MTFFVELAIDDIRGFLRQLDQRIAKEIILVCFDRMHIGAEGQPRGEAVVGGRRTVEIIALHFELERFTRFELILSRAEIELHALGKEFLNTQGQALRRDVHPVA